MPLSKYAISGLTVFTRSIWFNKLLRQTYKRLPLPWHIKQRLKKIYIRLPGAWEIRPKDVFRFGKLEALPQVAISAKQFDVASPLVLFVAHLLPTHSNDDLDSVRILAIVRLLREMGFGITFISDSENYPPHHQNAMEKDGINVLHGFDATRSHLAQNGGKYHFVLLSGPEVAFRYLPYVRAYALYSKLIYDTVDLHWVRFEREMQISGDRALLDVITQFRRIELYNTACADLVLAIADEEKTRLLIEQPDAKVTTLPNIQEIIPPKTPFGQRRGLLFIGDFWHKSNEDAVTFFVKNILPRITEKIPDLVFYIIGSNIPPSIESLRSPNVEPLGSVPDITPYFESCRIFVAPLRFGTGMKGKVGCSVSHGLPAVATRIGAEGMDLRHEKHLLIAEDPENFADMVVRLYNDEALWRRLSAESLMHLATNYSLAATRERMIDIFVRTHDESSRGGCHEDNNAIPACSQTHHFDGSNHRRCMSNELQKQALHRVLVVGIYLADKKNLASRITQELALSCDWNVEQQWVSLGKSQPNSDMAPFTVQFMDTASPKFLLLNQLLKRIELYDFEYVIVCDDDIELPAGFVDRYLAMVCRHDLAVAQPARTHDSYIDHRFVEQLDGIDARRTRFVEIGPLFSLHRSAFDYFLPFDEASPMGWGNDFVWPVLAEKHGLRMGIVDAVPVAHNFRKPVAYYDHEVSAKHMSKYLDERPHLSKKDAFSILESYVG